MSEQLKKVLVFAAIAVGAVVFILWMLLDPPTDHIEDTNGPDDTSLSVITDEDIAACDMGARGGPSTSEVSYNVAGFDVTSGTKYYADKYSGVYRLHSCYITKGSDVYISLVGFEIEEGNFEFCILLDGEIIGRVEPNDEGLSEFRIDDLEKGGTLEYVIAGESASFEFTAPTEW